MRHLSAAALVALLAPTGAGAAAPEFGTREGDLACAGLVNLGFVGAAASKPPVPEVVTSIGVAMGFYYGRLSKGAPDASLEDIDKAVAGLTLEEKNSFGALCIRKAAELMRPLAR